MKYKDFAKTMQRSCFTFAEARLVALATPVPVLRLQLHQWAKAGDITRLKNGVYCFTGRADDPADIVRVLYSPCYFSLEYALNYHGLIPDVPFTFTLVTPKLTRRIATPLGRFEYRRIHPDLFWGFDPGTLMGEKEKTLLDFCYFNGAVLKASPCFWETLRLQNLDTLDFAKLALYAKRFRSAKMRSLIASITEYHHGKR